jgi:peptide/nickel transport system substrate-binding protein
MYYWATGEWLPLLATEWAFIQTGETGAPGESAGAQSGGSPVASPAASPAASPSASPAAGGIDVNADTFAVKLREGVVWSDGTPFTSKDVVDTLWCLRILSQTVWQYVDEVTAVDDLTVHFHMSVPSTVVERYVIRTAVPRPSSVYGEWAQRARDIFGAGKTIDDPEGAQLLEQFNTFRPENIPASGPYMFDYNSVSNAQLTLVKNDRAWNADKALFDRIVNYNGETDVISAVVLNKDVDYATHGFAPATEQQMLQSGIRVLRPPVYSGPSLLMNFATLGSAFGDKRARQALAHAIDRQRNGTIALAESGIAVQYMTGMSDNLVPNWIAEPDVASLNQYEYDVEKAAALLQEAGWTKEGDVWKTPDGQDAAFELMFPAEFADWSAAGQDLAAQLIEFGIAIEPRAITHTQDDIDIDKGNFQLALHSWGNSSNPHPHFSFTTAFFDRNTLAVNNGGEGIAFPLQQESDVAGTVDLNDLTVQSAQGLDEAQQKAQVTTIAQVFNELLPKIPLFERYGNNAALEGVRVAAWPADDDPILQNSPYADGIPTMLMYEGKLEPVQG